MAARDFTPFKKDAFSASLKFGFSQKNTLWINPGFFSFAAIASVSFVFVSDNSFSSSVILFWSPASEHADNIRRKKRNLRFFILINLLRSLTNSVEHIK